MGRTASIISCTTKNAYAVPDRKKVLALVASQGWEAAYDRWSESQTPASLHQLVLDEKEATGTANPKTMIRPVEARRIVTLCLGLRSVVRTARALAISEDRVYKALNQTGTPAPKLSPIERRLATLKGVEKARAPKGKPVQATLFELPDLGVLKALAAASRAASRAALWGNAV